MPRFLTPPGFLLAAAAFLVYNLNLRPISSADTFPTRYLPISVIQEGDLDLDEFPFLFRTGPWFDGEGTPYFLRNLGGHYYSTYPVGAALTAVPIYVIPVLLGLTDDAQDATISGFSRTEVVGTALSKLTASLAIALSVWLVHAGALALGGDRRTAFWVAAAYAFATSSWSLSSQGLWQSTMSQLWLSLAWYSLAVLPRSPRWITWTGVALALAVASRPTTLPFAVAISAWVALHRRDLLLRFLPFPILVGALLLAYNLWLGSLVGGYGTTPAHLSFFRPIALAGLLFSPSRGLLTMSPVLVVGVLGFGAAMRRPAERWWIYIAAASIATIGLHSFSQDWHAGFSYSYRYLIDLVPGLALAATFALPALWARRTARYAMGVAFAFSVGIQIIGAFYYPCGWFHSPPPLREHPERAFDWIDSEPLRCLRSGLVRPEILGTDG
jgi:hypothetical protein